MNAAEYHIPVLLNEAVNFLITDRSGIYFDATAGFGGHSEAILKRLEDSGKLICIDKDITASEYLKEKFNSDSRVKIFNAGFNDINSIAKIERVEKFDGILADLGVSSFQLDDADSGFTYRQDAPLDMRMDKTKGIPASKVINKFEAANLSDIFFRFGEERRSKQIARKIVEKRRMKKIVNTFQLKEIIKEVVPEPHLFSTLSRIFQALRIYINNELDELKNFLEASIELLKTNGRVVVISYHSLEDRIVKEFFKYESSTCICPPEVPVCICQKEQRLKILSKKPVIPGEDEIKLNRRARSAKLRCAERI